MKKFFFVCAVIITAIISAGCVSPTDQITGTWTTLHAYEEEGVFYTIVKEISSDNTGYLIWTADDGSVDEPWERVWYPLGNNTYMNYYQGAVIYFTILDNGNAADNYNLTFIRS